MGLLDGKKGLILGVANKRSIAWGIAQSAAAQGAELAFSFQGERLEEGVRELAGTLKNSLVYPCDVMNEDQVNKMFAEIDKTWGGLDFLAHCIAYAKAEDIGPDSSYVATKREGFDLAMDVSAYSFTLVTQKAAPLMEKRGGGSLITLSYLGAERVLPNYNVMGVAKAALEAGVRYLANDLGPKNIRVNAISAGPTQTLAARGIAGFMDLYKAAKEKSPLRTNTDPPQVGDTAAFLFSSLSRGITGQTIYVDSGYSIIGF